MAAFETRSASSLTAKIARVSHGYLLRVLFRGKTVRKRSRARTVTLDFPFFLNSRIIVFSHTNRTKGFMEVFS